MISLIVAMSDNRAIGLRGSLPWHLPGDLAHFKKTTMGRPVIMGRKTYASLNGPLPKRPNIVITRNRLYMAMGAAVAHDLDEAIERAKAIARAGADDGEIFILGGAEVYRQALPLADRLYITHVHADVEGDTFFPEYDESQWRVLHEERHEADAKNALSFTIRTYERR